MVSLTLIKLIIWLDTWSKGPGAQGGLTELQDLLLSGFCRRFGEPLGYWDPMIERPNIEG